MLGSKTCTPKSLLSVAPKTGLCSVLPSLCFPRHVVVSPFDNMAPAAPLNADCDHSICKKSTASARTPGQVSLWLHQPCVR